MSPIGTRIIEGIFCGFQIRVVWCTAMIQHTKSLSTVVAIIAATTMLSAFAPSATAAGRSTGAVASARSFRVETPEKNLFQEAVSTTVDSNSKWNLADSSASSMNVPTTPSQAEKDAAARAEQERVAAQEAAAAQQSAAASRSQERAPLTNTGSNSSASAPAVNVAAPDSATASSLLSFAGSFVGVAPYVYGGNTPSGWDCSGFVQYVFASIGISLPHSSGAQAGIGRAVGSLDQAQPGDIIANSTHVGIYVGNGMVVNALNPGQGTQYTSVGTAFTGGYSIRRVL